MSEWFERVCDRILSSDKGRQGLDAEALRLCGVYREEVRRRWKHRSNGVQRHRVKFAIGFIRAFQKMNFYRGEDGK